MKKRTVALLMSAILLLGATIGSTIAWLQVTSNEVNNTFTFGDINIKLDEKDTDDSTPNADRDAANAYDLIPGDTEVKDPKVTVESGSEKCYVFVTVTEKYNTMTVDTGESVETQSIIQYDVNDANWIWVAENELTNGTTTLYVYTTDTVDTGVAGDTLDPTPVDASAAEVVTESVLASFTVKDAAGNDVSQNITVNSNLTKEMIEAMAGADKTSDADDTYPTIDLKACAVQSENITYAEVVNIAKELLGVQ